MAIDLRTNIGKLLQLWMYCHTLKLILVICLHVSTYFITFERNFDCLISLMDKIYLHVFAILKLQFLLLLKISSFIAKQLKNEHAEKHLLIRN